jgi:transposase
VGRSLGLPWRVSDRLWERLAPVLADPPRRFRYPGRLRYPARQCLEGILYVLYTDTPWLQVSFRELGLPSGETCRRRLEEWQAEGLFAQALSVLQRELADAGRLDCAAADRRLLAGGREEGGEAVARALRGTPGSRFQLAVDAHGAPLAVRVSAGNENEQRHLLPLLDELLERGIKPRELWADRGYASHTIRQALSQRAIEPRISQPRKPGEPIPDGARVREVWRGKQRRLKVSDPAVRQRWPGERTNAWLQARRRIATRRDRKTDNYLAFLQLAMILILIRSF